MSASGPRRAGSGEPRSQAGILPHWRVLELHKAVIDAGLGRGSLLVGLPKAYIASLPGEGAPGVQILSDLAILNQTGRFEDGSLAFEVWLQNAEHLTAERAERRVFSGALGEVRAAAETYSEKYEAPRSEPTLKASRRPVPWWLTVTIIAFLVLFWVCATWAISRKFLAVAPPAPSGVVEAPPAPVEAGVELPSASASVVASGGPSAGKSSAPPAPRVPRNCRAMRSYSGRLWDSKIDCANPSCRAATSAEVETYSAALKGCGEAAMSCVCP